MSATKTRLYEFGEFRLDAGERVLYWRGEPVALTHKTFDLLLVLVESGGRILEHDELMRAVWPDTAVDSSSLKKAVSSLRRSLGDEPENSTFIQTLPRRGYRFVARVSVPEGNGRVLVERYTTSEITIEDVEVEEEELPDGSRREGDREPPAYASNGAAGGRAGAGPPRGQLAPARLSVAERLTAAAAGSRALAALGALAFVAVAVVLLSSYYAGREDSVAVMPFTYAAGDGPANDPHSEYLSDGLTESIIQSLSHSRGLKVIARGSVFRYKGREVDPREVGRTLDVRKVLSGRITRRGDALTVSAELIDTRDGRLLWGHTYEVDVSGLLAVRSELAAQISRQLRVRLTVEDERRVAKQYTEDAEAYALYLRGRYFWNKRTEGDLRKGIAYFQQAVEKDPQYALAHAALAESYALLISYSDAPPGESAYAARQAAQKALALDGQLAEAHAALGQIALDYDRDWPEADREYRRAIEINPNYATAHHWLGLSLALWGRFEEALAEIGRAKELDPVSLSIGTAEGTVLYYARQYDRAIARYEKVIELHPHARGLRLHLSDAYLQNGMYAEAAAELHRVAQGDNEPPVKARFGLLRAMTGERAEALKIAEELGGAGAGGSQFFVAGIYAALGEREKALARLEEGLRRNEVELKQLKVNPMFESLHTDPRFADLLRRLKLPA